MATADIVIGQSLELLPGSPVSIKANEHGVECGRRTVL
jgi:hypothetical protein